MLLEHYQTTENNNNSSINKTISIQNLTTTPQDNFRKTTIDNLAETPTNRTTITSIDICTTTTMTIRRNAVLAAPIKYNEVIYLTNNKLDLTSKARGQYQMDILVINEIDQCICWKSFNIQDLFYDMVFVNVSN